MLVLIAGAKILLFFEICKRADFFCEWLPREIVEKSKWHDLNCMNSKMIIVITLFQMRFLQVNGISKTLLNPFYFLWVRRVDREYHFAMCFVFSIYKMLVRIKMLNTFLVIYFFANSCVCQKKAVTLSAFWEFVITAGETPASSVKN